ncbi:hypothetical protein GCM10007933_24170 [Zoogloea oryzae]|uniref:Uncharacterized protein n=1 Tax=Zoogloea oryzae TaxID=310767 RepID=A0ABQ6FCD8_9RHOO|nr:hypothetical protein GCM10007933_24170 [Zoogloea oryzae]
MGTPVWNADLPMRRMTITGFHGKAVSNSQSAYREAPESHLFRRRADCRFSYQPMFDNCGLEDVIHLDDMNETN